MTRNFGGKWPCSLRRQSGRLKDVPKRVSRCVAKRGWCRDGGAGVGFAQYRSGAQPEFLMIKAICDWADTNKNDKWQEYAAHSSAAFAVLLLEDIAKMAGAAPPSNVPALSVRYRTLGHLLQLRPRLPGVPTLLKLRLSPLPIRRSAIGVDAGRSRQHNAV
jgi:hypothetical protein